MATWLMILESSHGMVQGLRLNADGSKRLSSVGRPPVDMTRSDSASKAKEVFQDLQHGSPCVR